MALFGRRAADTQYGIRVKWEDGDTSEHWFADEPTRDRKHNDYARKPKTVMVQNIQRAK